MLTFGGGSVKRNGVYDQVVAALEGRDLVEFWGIEANPSVETLRKAIALGKERKVDFLLAVGGGSVIDGDVYKRQALPGAQRADRRFRHGRHDRPGDGRQHVPRRVHFAALYAKGGFAKLLIHVYSLS